MRLRIKFIVLSMIAAISISAIQLWISLNMSINIMWQATLMQKFVGSGPILGYDANGQPLHEGTPVHMAAAFVGVLLGVVIYSAIIYFLINKKWHNKKINKDNLFNRYV